MTMDSQKAIGEFSLMLEAGDKAGALSYVLTLLESHEASLVEVYEGLLSPALNQMVCREEDRRICIWNEHVHTAIIRTIVENCFPYVMREKDHLGFPSAGTAAVLCPPEENHDLGARIVSDYLTICGYNAIFVGSNTPYEDFLSGIEIIKPKLIAISVSNYYHIVVTKRIIAELKEKADPKAVIVVGGFAFDSNPDHIKAVGADHYARSFEDIKAIARGAGATEGKVVG